MANGSEGARGLGSNQLMESGEMARRVREMDWSRTPLGSMEKWPASLRVAVGICLTSRFPMFVWWGPELINIYNDAYGPVLGNRHPAALGQSARGIWAEIWDVVGPQADAVMQRGEATWNERVLLVMQRKGYEEKTWFTWSYSPITDEFGKIGGVFCACTEETMHVHAQMERERLEREREGLVLNLQNERAKLAAVIEKSPAFICTLRGPTHIFEIANDRYKALVDGRELIGKTIGEALPEVKEQGFIDLLDQVYATGEPFSGNEAPVLLRQTGEDGLKRVFLNFVYQALREADGTISGIFVHGIDVTPVVEARDVMRENESRLRQLADLMPQIVWSAQADATVDYYNERWYEYTGLARNDAAPAESWKEVPDAESLERIAADWERSLRMEEPLEGEYRLRRYDGEYRWHLSRAVPVRDSSGKLVRWFGTSTDIHDQKKLHEENEQLLASERAARAQAERTSQMKDEFLATLSHELRTPLNAIVGWSQILRSAPPTEEDLREGLEIIDRNARAQATIIEDLLDMSRIMSGKVRLDVQRIPLAPVIEAAVGTVRAAADAKGVRLQVVLDPLAGPVSGDPNRLQQVFWNLLSNSIKFTPRHGRVQVLLERVNSHLEITVTDTGEGIDPAFIPYVFDRFRQADATTTRRHGGLGLGLAIVKQLVELHGGTVSARSGGKGHGATFTVRLPVLAVHAEDAADSDSRRHPAAAASIPIQVEACLTLKGIRVLVVDDEADARLLLRRLLEDCEAQVMAAGSAKEAFELFQTSTPDVVVSDIGMPVEDGYGLIRRIRALPSEKGGDVPAVALTAYARAEDRMKAILAGFQLHVTKPVEPAELITMVASLVQRLGKR